VIPSIKEIHIRLCEINDLDPKTHPVKKTWPDNCYAVATALVELLPKNARTAYGFWYGTDKRNPERPLSRHGWAKFNGKILDPTRWVFEKKEPYLFVCKEDKCKEYDEGMTEFKEAFERPAPERDKTQRIMSFKWTTNEAAFLTNLFGERRDWGKMSMGEYFWLANKQPKRILPIISSFYKQLKKQNSIGIVPIDFIPMFEDLQKQGLVDG